MGFALIERYIFKKALIAVLVAAGGLIGVLWVVRAVQQVDVILNQGQGITTYLKMTTLGVPTLAAAIAPMALLIGLIQTINTLNSDSELVIVHASGASRMTLLKPFLALSGLVMVVVYVLHLWAGPASMQTLRTYVTQVRADLVSVVVREGAFQDVGSGLTFHVAQRAPGGVLKGVFILDGRNDKETLTYLATEGTISKVENKTYLVLQDGQIQRLQQKSQNLSVIKFKSYAFNLSSFSGKKAASAGSQMELSTAQLLFPDANDSFYKSYPGRYRSELHTRLTGGLYPIMVGLLLLAYLGNPFSHRQGQGLIVTTACAVIIGLRAVGVVAEGSLREQHDMIYLVWGIPVVTIAVASILLATDKTAYSPKLIAWMDTQIYLVSKKSKPILDKILRRERIEEVQA